MSRFTSSRFTSFGIEIKTRDGCVQGRPTFMIGWTFERGSSSIVEANFVDDIVGEVFIGSRSCSDLI